ncbi:MAG: hypothetical protein CBC38_05660 [Gammaproteobacteria bacterium TMED78]|nr:MAG: hypothetical protein CBC38_05660 [Gammaproteobacteria bacterium TMED78]|tara:strand:- start:538 stop:1080 length:543 start_codon:yes stop_codon:yes gene_type:complete
MNSRNRSYISLLGVFVVLFVSFFGNNVIAQDNGLKLGVVDVSRLLSQSPQYLAIMEILQEEFAPRERDIIAIQTSLQEKAELYERDAAVMGEEERQSLEREISNDQRDLAREQEQATEDFNLRQNQELSRLQGILIEAINEFSSSEDYDLVVADALYYSIAVDITDEVLQTLQNSFESVD